MELKRLGVLLATLFAMELVLLFISLSFGQLGLIMGGGLSALVLLALPESTHL
jgi:hypothetical protein